MKKIIFLLAIVCSVSAYSQQTITAEQQEVSAQTHIRVKEFNKKIETKVQLIVDAVKLDEKKVSELRGIVRDRESMVIRIEREAQRGETNDLQGTLNDVQSNYEKRLKEVLGTEKYNLLKSKQSPK